MPTLADLRGLRQVQAIVGDGATNEAVVAAGADAAVVETDMDSEAGQDSACPEHFLMDGYSDDDLVFCCDHGDTADDPEYISGGEADMDAEAGQEPDDSGGDGDGGHAGPVADVDNISQMIGACRISAVGDVLHTLPKFERFHRLGRLIHWPRDVPANKISTSMRCQIHPNCSVSKKQQAASTDQFLAWLVQAEVPDKYTSKDEKENMKIKHKALWANMWKDGPPNPPWNV